MNVIILRFYESMMICLCNSVFRCFNTFSLFSNKVVNLISNHSKKSYRILFISTLFINIWCYLIISLRYLCFERKKLSLKEFLYFLLFHMDTKMFIISCAVVHAFDFVLQLLMVSSHDAICRMKYSTIHRERERTIDWD